MNIALFDLDNTLIKGDSDYQWGNYLVENNYVDPKLYKEKNENFFEQYRNGTLCAREFAEFSYEPLTKYDYKTLINIRKKFFEEKIKPLIHPKAVDLIKSHKEKKDILAIVTATNSFISRVSADYFEINDHNYVYTNCVWHCIYFFLVIGKYLIHTPHFLVAPQVL